MNFNKDEDLRHFQRNWIRWYDHIEPWEFAILLVLAFILISTVDWWLG